MNPFSKIFNRFDILKITFKGPEEYTWDKLSYKRSGCGWEWTGAGEKSGNGSVKWEKEIPVIAVFCGHGIISKSREMLPQKVLESISGHGEEFIWSEKRRDYNLNAAGAGIGGYGPVK